MGQNLVGQDVLCTPFLGRARYMRVIAVADDLAYLERNVFFQRANLIPAWRLSTGEWLSLGRGCVGTCTLCKTDE